MIPFEYPPRVRVEWFLAAARVVLAGGALIALSFDISHSWPAQYTLLWYLIYSLGILALVWAPVRFAASWDVGLHVCDLIAFAALMVVTRGDASLFLVALTFLLVSATLRWQTPGTIYTTLGAALAFGVATSYAALLDNRPFDADAFVIRMLYLLLVAAMLTYLGAHHRKYYEEIGQLAAWPRTMSRQPSAIIAEVLSRAGELLNTPRMILIWHDAEEAALNLAWLQDGQVVWKQETPDAYGSLVSPTLIGRAFQTADAAHDRSQVVVLTRGRFLRRRCRPIDERLRTRFEMRVVQSWPLDGDIVRGRIFSLDKSSVSLDDLTVGEFVARLATSRLDSLYLLERLQEARALEERLRVARDLHDSLLQSQAGAALQLLAARRLLERDPATATQRLAQVQQQLEHGELEMRAFIRDLRPDGPPVTRAPRASLGQRLHELARRIEEQWSVKVLQTIDAAAESLDDRVTEDVYRLVQEALVNAARHADASVVHIGLAVADARVCLSVTDDGKGFPFTGTYDLPSLDAMSQGPVTLRERVAELNGNLTLTSSSEAGTKLLISVPLGAV